MKMWAAVRGAQWCSCFYCGKFLPRSRDRTHDHVVARIHGGDRFVTSCAGCNVAKGDLSVEEYRALVWEQRGQRLRAEAWLAGKVEVVVVPPVVFHGEKMGWKAW